jgi:hypothetical protein
VTVFKLPTGNLFRVVGESHCQDALRRTALELARLGEPPMPVEADIPDVAERSWFLAVLIPEPDNPHDRNAVGVWSEVGQLGYLPRDDAADFAKVFDLLRARGANAAACAGALVGGDGDKPSYGVVLALSRPDDCLEALQR